MNNNGMFRTTLLLLSSVITICTVGLASGGCCTTTINYCTKNLPATCQQDRHQEPENVLFNCQIGIDPTFIMQCDFGCRILPNGQNAECSVDAGPSLTHDDEVTSSSLVMKPKVDQVSDDEEESTTPKKPRTTSAKKITFPTTSGLDDEDTTITTKRTTTRTMYTTRKTTSTTKKMLSTTTPKSLESDADEEGSVPEVDASVSSTFNLDTRSVLVQRVILNTINLHRRQVRAANMLEITWDPVAAKSARDYVNRCSFTVNKNSKGSNFGKCGQILAIGNGYKTWTDVIASWQAEEKNFWMGQNPCFRRGTHYRAYTQLVWAHSYAVGCAMAACPAAGGPLFICQFCPQGNFNGECRPYLEGSTENGGVCGKCGGRASSDCDDGLCTNPCPYENRLKECDNLFPDAASCKDSKDDPNRAKCQATCNCRDSGQIYWIN